MSSAGPPRQIHIPVRQVFGFIVEGQTPSPRLSEHDAESEARSASPTPVIVPPPRANWREERTESRALQHMQGQPNPLSEEKLPQIQLRVLSDSDPSPFPEPRIKITENRTSNEMAAPQPEMLLAQRVLGRSLVEHAAACVEDEDVIVICAYSPVLLDSLSVAMTQGRKFHVVVVDGPPEMPGLQSVRWLQQAGVPCSYTYFHLLASIMKEMATKVILPASYILPDGLFKSPVGATTVAMAAHAARKPVIVLLGAMQHTPLLPSTPRTPPVHVPHNHAVETQLDYNQPEWNGQPDLQPGLQPHLQHGNTENVGVPDAVIEAQATDMSRRVALDEACGVVYGGHADEEADHLVLRDDTVETRDQQRDKQERAQVKLDLTIEDAIIEEVKEERAKQREGPSGVDQKVDQDAVTDKVKEEREHASVEVHQDAVKDKAKQVVKEALEEMMKTGLGEGIVTDDVKEEIKAAVREAVKEAVKEVVKEEVVRGEVKGAVKDMVQNEVESVMAPVVPQDLFTESSHTTAPEYNLAEPSFYPRFCTPWPLPLNPSPLPPLPANMYQPSAAAPPTVPLPSILPASVPPSVLPSVPPSVLPSAPPSVLPGVLPRAPPNVLLPGVLTNSAPPNVLLPGVLPSAPPNVLPGVLPSAPPNVLLPGVLPSAPPTVLPGVLPGAPTNVLHGVLLATLPPALSRAHSTLPATSAHNEFQTPEARLQPAAGPMTSTRLQINPGHAPPPYDVFPLVHEIVSDNKIVPVVGDGAHALVRQDTFPPDVAASWPPTAGLSSLLQHRDIKHWTQAQLGLEHDAVPAGYITTVVTAAGATGPLSAQALAGHYMPGVSDYIGGEWYLS